MRKRMIFVSLAFFMIGTLDYPAAALAHQPPHMSAKIKALIREDDALDERCRAPSGDANDHNCLLRGRILLKLMHLGWCWDSEKMDPIEADKHWMRCSEAHKVP